jgi:hypothetical protein
VDVSRRAARERNAHGRRLAGDRLHLGDFLRGENGAGGPCAVCL